MKSIFRKIINFLVPTPATVRRHRAPSARFRTLEALAKTHGDTLTRDGRSYTLTTSDLRVLEFENLAQVKAFMSEPIALIKEVEPYFRGATTGNFPNIKRLDEADRADGGPYPGGADYVERPRNMYKIGALSPAVAQGDTYDIGGGPRREVYNILPDGSMKPGPACDVGSAKPFVPVVATPITNDIIRD